MQLKQQCHPDVGSVAAVEIDLSVSVCVRKRDRSSLGTSENAA